MKLFKRAASAINDHYDVATDLAIALDPSIRRVKKLEARGTPANGVVTGIHFSLNDGTTRKEYAVTVAGGAGPRIGVRTQANEGHRLRLGMPVVVKLDGSRGILDWDAMAAAWGLTGQFLAQDSLRKPPDDGIVDSAIDMSVQRRLKKWTPGEATIVALSRRTVMGMATLNWDVQVQMADGHVALSKRDEVPSYAQWFTAPGAVVPVTIDPDDRSRAAIDWRRFALAQSDAVGFDDDPPEGSIAAEIESSRGAGETSTMGAGAPAPAPDGEAVTLDATMRSWIDAFHAGHMSANDLGKALDDWTAAGMCSQAQAAAARQSVAL
jgi:hypothetical protein